MGAAATTTTTTPAAEGRDRRTMGRPTLGSWAPCWGEAAAEDATAAGGRDKPRMREMPAQGSLVSRIFSVAETTTTAAATVDINQPTLTTTIPTTTTLIIITQITTTLTTTINSSVSITTT